MASVPVVRSASSPALLPTAPARPATPTRDLERGDVVERARSHSEPRGLTVVPLSPRRVASGFTPPTPPPQRAPTPEPLSPRAAPASEPEAPPVGSSSGGDNRKCLFWGLTTGGVLTAAGSAAVGALLIPASAAGGIAVIVGGALVGLGMFGVGCVAGLSKVLYPGNQN